MSYTSTPRLPIRVAAQRAGISTATLRAWERRYGAISPARTTGEQRLYSDADVERIALLLQLTRSGVAISAIATESTSALRELAGATSEPAALPALAEHGVVGATEDALAACLDAVRAHDGEALHHLLLREAIRATPLEFIERVAAPLSRQIGEAWAAGEISEAQERVASTIIRRVLALLLQVLGTPVPARPTRRVLITTLSGERHENGALMAGVVAALAGCAVTYPGADLPAAAIAQAAAQADASIVGVSVLDAGSPRRALRELEALRAALPKGVRLVVGGAAAPVLSAVIDRGDATYLGSLESWHAALQTGDV